MLFCYSLTPEKREHPVEKEVNWLDLGKQGTAPLQQMLTDSARFKRKLGAKSLGVGVAECPPPPKWLCWVVKMPLALGPPFSNNDALKTVFLPLSL